MKQLSSLLLYALTSISVFAQNDLLWRFPTDSAIYSTPVISGDHVYFGSSDTYLYSLTKSGGKLNWKFKTNGKVNSSVAATEKSVLFSSMDGKIYAVNKTNGALQWTFKTRGEQRYDLWDYYLSSPVVHNQVVYDGSGDSSIYALDAVNGKKIWQYKTNGIVHATPVIKDSTVFVGSYDGWFYALDSKNGNLRWKFKTVGDAYFPKGEIQKAAIIHKNTIYFGSRDFNIYALDLVTGTGRWNMKERGSWVIATPHFYNDNIYFGTSDTHRFYAMNAESGEIKWTLPINMRVYGTASSIGNQIIFGSFNGKIYFVDAETGQVNSTFQTPESKKSYAGLFDANDHLRKDVDLYGNEYLLTEKKILALGSIVSSPVADNNMLYFGDTNGYFYALKLQ
jgi:outer membrane protein assembly factor BamB